MRRTAGVDASVTRDRFRAARDSLLYACAMRERLCLSCFPGGTTSPSSFVNGPMSGLGRMSSTASEGRHRRVPFGVTTIGRLIRIGCAIMKSISSSSLHLGSARPSSIVGRALVAQKLARRRCPWRGSARQAARGSAEFSDTRSHAGSSPAGADHGQGVARRAAGWVVIDGDAHRFIPQPLWFPSLGGRRP